MSKLYRIISSPFPCDEDLPWEYEEDGFVRWVDEVFLEGWKKGDDAPFPSPQECVDILEGAGYTVEVRDEEQVAAR